MFNLKTCLCSIEGVRLSMEYNMFIAFHGLSNQWIVYPLSIRGKVWPTQTIWSENNYENSVPKSYFLFKIHLTIKSENVNINLIKCSQFIKKSYHLTVAKKYIFNQTNKCSECPRIIFNQYFYGFIWVQWLYYLPHIHWIKLDNSFDTNLSK